MPYYFVFKEKSRNWGQHHLGDYDPNLVLQHCQFLDRVVEARWKLKKKRHNTMKQKGFPVKVLRRGRIPVLYPQKEVFRMDNPQDIAQAKKISWFSSCWTQNRTNTKSNHSSPYIQTNLSNYAPNLIKEPYVPLNSDEIIYGREFYTPHFHEPRYVQKVEYCKNMAPWAWEACRFPKRKVGHVSHLFYLNDFSYFDSNNIIERVNGKKSAFLPSDIIRYSLYRRLQGFTSISDFFRMIEISPNIMDYIGVKMTHQIPSSNRFSGYLKAIGIEAISQFFHQLVQEARNLGLIKDQIHIWDGQFHETWIKKDIPRKQGLPQFFGGTYNHGGNKVGIGIYQSTIMDWNGYCTIPIYTSIVPANRNENPVMRETIIDAYQDNPKPDYFLADRGPSGEETQDTCAKLHICPLIPLRESVKKDVIVTKDKEKRFYKKYVKEATGSWLERMTKIRTRIEEHYNLNDTLYKTQRIRSCGQKLINIELLLVNCLGVLIPITAYKIGRPDLMWQPSQFRNQSLHPERIFPHQFRQLNDFRWDNAICMSPSRYKAWIKEEMVRYS